MTLQELNVRLNKVDLNLRTDRMTNHYDTWFEYYDHTRKKWGILHSLGYYKTKENAVKSACNWLAIQHIHY